MVKPSSCMIESQNKTHIFLSNSFFSLDIKYSNNLFKLDVFSKSDLFLNVSIQVSVLRLGKISDEISVKIDTIDGSANEGEDYVGIHGIFTFAAGQSEIEITVEIVDDDDWEPDEEFFLKMALNPACESKVKIGMRHIMTIMILNDDEPGTFGFDKRGHFVKVRTTIIGDKTFKCGNVM